MSLTRKIAGHTILYGSAQILIMLSGVISMPILTRWLSEDQYGLLNLIGIAILLAGTLFTGGLRQSIARFYGEYRHAGTLSESTGTYLLGVFVLAVAGLAVTVAAFPILVALGVLPRWALSAALLASVLVLVRLGFSGIGCLYRMREQVVTFNIFDISTKYLAMGLCIWFVVTGADRLFEYFRGLVIGESLVFVVLCALFFARPHEARLGFAPGPARQMFRYGLPLMAGSMASIMFQQGDRYVINYFLGPGQVALYSVGSQLAGYTCTALVSGFEFALVPVIMNAWGAGDKDRARETLGSLVRYYALAAFPVAAGLIATRSGVVHLMASEKYLSAVSVVPLVVPAALVLGFASPLLIGLHFAQKTRTLALLSGAMAALSILLNALLLPAHGLLGDIGILGAGIVTLTCSTLLVVIGALLARKHCAVPIPWSHLARYALAALILFASVSSISLSHWLVTLAVQIASGTVIYVGLILLLDPPLRRFIFGWLRAHVRT